MLKLLAEYESSKRAKSFRHTKIIATLGPATEEKTLLQSMIRTGVDIMRLNMAHASHQWVADVIWHIREASSKVSRDVAIMMDVKGPEIRTGVLESPLTLEPGAVVVFHTTDHICNQPNTNYVSVNYAGLPADVEIGAEMLVDSGLIRLSVIDKDATSIRAEVRVGGMLGSRRHINLPGVHVRLPALTKKDEDDLRAGVAAGIDFVALSFVREAADVLTLRRFLDGLGSRAKIIAKLEDQAGLDNSEEIIKQADGIMVARGDLGVEIEFQFLPWVQSKLVQLCQSDGKPVIIASQL
ncbi:MAG: pyruvate kinase, partial [Planctomycetaceae bacterium]|nr:pyruvate kinase [Planctomycetaceae bacterium]